MRTSFARFVKDESGATAIEYGLIAAGIAVAIITAVQAVGDSLCGLFETISADSAAEALVRPKLIGRSQLRALRGWDRPKTCHAPAVA